MADLEQPRVFTNGKSEYDLENWRERGEMRSLGNRFAYLLGKKMFLDTKFLLGEDKIEFGCHKLVLVSSSSVFAVMFTGDLAQKTEEPISIPDIEPEVFIASVEYLYTGLLRVEEERLNEVLYMGVKYDLAHLVEACCEVLIHNLNSSNAATLYQTAKFFNISYLQHRAYKYMRENPDATLKNADFLSLSLQNMATIISQNDFITNELDIFNAVICWGETQCQRKDLAPTGKNLRDVLGDSIYLIRFSRFIPLYISRFVVAKGLFTDEEIVTLYQYSSLCSTDLEYLPPTKFTIQDRVIPLYDVKLFEVCQEGTQKKKGANFMKKSVIFSVDRDITITHLLLHGLSDLSNATYKVIVSLILYRPGEGWIDCHELTCIGVKGFGNLRLNLPHHFPIYRYVWYQIVLESQKTMKTEYGMAKNPVKVICGENGPVTFFMDCSAEKSVDQVEIGFKI